MSMIRMMNMTLRPLNTIPEPFKTLPEFVGKEKYGLLYQVVFSPRKLYKKARLITEDIPVKLVDMFTVLDWRAWDDDGWDSETVGEFNMLIPSYIVEYEDVCYFAPLSQFRELVK